jgi:hypothetical protein
MLPFERFLKIIDIEDEIKDMMLHMYILNAAF